MILLLEIFLALRRTVARLKVRQIVLKKNKKVITGI